jgi:hypothetical protein
MLSIEVATVHGEFLSDVPGAPFDLVVFFEAFHHALNHQVLLYKLHGIVADEGRVLFAGEPIIPEGDYWAPAVAMSLARPRGSASCVRGCSVR